MAEPRAASTKDITSVAGGHTIRSVLRTSAPAPWVMRANSATEPLRPFIFQLPATSGRRWPCDIVTPVRKSHQRVSKVTLMPPECRIVAAQRRPLYDPPPLGLRLSGEDAP